MKKLLISILSLTALLGLVYVADAAPTSTTVQNLIITALKSGSFPCLDINSAGLVATTTCGSGGGGSGSFNVSTGSPSYILYLSNGTSTGVGTPDLTYNSTTQLFSSPSGTFSGYVNVGNVLTAGLNNPSENQTAIRIYDPGWPAYVNLMGTVNSGSGINIKFGGDNGTLPVIADSGIPPNSLVYSSDKWTLAGLASTTNTGYVLTATSTAPFFYWAPAAAGGGGSITSSTPITQFNFPFWYTAAGGLSGTSTLSIGYQTSTQLRQNGAFNASGTITQNGVAVLTGNQTVTVNVNGDVTSTGSGATTINLNATTTGLQGKVLPALASGTLQFIDNVWKLNNVTSALGLYNASGTVTAYGGASACAAGNAVTTISAVGGTTCAPFGNMSTIAANTITGEVPYFITSASSTLAATSSLTLNAGGSLNESSSATFASTLTQSGGLVSLASTTVSGSLSANTLNVTSSATVGTLNIATTTSPGLAKVLVNGQIKYVMPVIATATTVSTTLDFSTAARQMIVIGLATTTVYISNTENGDSDALKLCQDGTGSRTVTWVASSTNVSTTIDWGTAGTPTLSTGVNKCDWFTFLTSPKNNNTASSVVAGFYGQNGFTN